ncbi:Protein of unknown function (DUF3445) domain containing protein [Tylopilus felleus]
MAPEQTTRNTPKRIEQSNWRNGRTRIEIWNWETCLGGTQQCVAYTQSHRLQKVWTPVAFKYREVTPCPLPISDVKPVPYRPFRWGEYHVTMGIRTMPWSEWIELDETFLYHQRFRTFRVSQRGKKILCVLPAREDESVKVVGGAEAVKELLYDLTEYLPQRYPSSFRVSRLPSSPPAPTIEGMPLSWHGKMPTRTIEAIQTEGNTILEGLWKSVLLIVSDKDGKYYLQAGLTCVPGLCLTLSCLTSLEQCFFTPVRIFPFARQIGMPCQRDEHRILKFSTVYFLVNEKLQLGMDHFFQRLPVANPVMRNNYSIQVIPLRLSWSKSINGPEDDFSHREHGARHVPYVSPSTLRLRSERQTLRRLPCTGAIVFGIRTYQFKVEEFAKERGVAARLASAIKSWPEDVAFYKGRERY